MLSRSFIFISFLVLYSQISFSQELTGEMIYKIARPDNIGTNFWFTVPPCYETENPDNAVKILIFSEYTTQVKIEVEDIFFVRTINTVPHEVVEVELTPMQAQPYTKSGTEDEKESELYKRRGIHLTSKMPVGVYVLVDYEGTSDGFLAMPAAVLGKKYVVSSYDALYSGDYKFPSIAGITAPYDNTKVTITIGGNENTLTADNLGPGEKMNVTLYKGDVFMFSSLGDRSDLSGTLINASKPVAVVAGHQCANVPRQNSWCDYLVEMLTGTETWGTKFAVPQIPGRAISSIIRIYAKENETSIYRNGNLIGMIGGPGGIKDEAWIEIRLNENPENPFPVYITSDKPVQIVHYNTGSQEDGLPRKDFDPFQMVLAPLEQYSPYIPFAMPKARNSSGFAENYFAAAFTPNSENLIPPYLLLGIGTEDTTRFHSLRNYYMAADCDVLLDKQLAVQSFETPPDSTLYLKHSEPLAVHLFGFDGTDSYGFPAYLMLKNLEKINDTAAPTINLTLNKNSGLIEADVQDLPDNSDIRSNLGHILINEEESFNIEYELPEIMHSIDYRTGAEIIVADMKKDARAVVTASDRNGNTSAQEINYYVIDFECLPRDVFFTGVLPSATVYRDIQLINNSNTQIETEKITAENYPELFWVENINLPAVINANSAATFTLGFSAAQIGEYNETLRVELSDDETYFNVNVTASVDEPEISAMDIDFGTITAGFSTVTQCRIRNNSDAMILNITSIKRPSSKAFIINLETPTPEAPLKINPKSIKSFNVMFAPKEAGEYLDSIVFSSDAGKTDSISVFTGTAVPSSVFEKAPAEKIKIYPIPAKSFLNLHLKGFNRRPDIRIKDAEGKDITSAVSIDGSLPKYRINTANLPAGAYFIEIHTDTKAYFRKFIINK